MPEYDQSRIQTHVFLCLMCKHLKLNQRQSTKKFAGDCCISLLSSQNIRSVNRIAEVRSFPHPFLTIFIALTVLSYPLKTIVFLSGAYKKSGRKEIKENQAQKSSKSSISFLSSRLSQTQMASGQEYRCPAMCNATNIGGINDVMN